MVTGVSHIGTRNREHQPSHEGQAQNLTCHLLFSSAWFDSETREKQRPDERPLRLSKLDTR